MSDEPDALVLRRFAESYRPLADARFVAEVSARLPAYSVGRVLRTGLGAVLTAMFAGLSFGIVRPLRLRNAGFVALAALGVCLWSILQGSL